MNEVCVVIPAHNEEATIGSVVHLARREARHVVVVDDGSTDRTAEVAQDAGAEVVRLEDNLGKGGALHAGFRVARERASVVVTLDGDGQHDPAQVGRLCRPILDGEADMVIGSRFLEGSESGAGQLRRSAQRLLAGASSTAGRVRTTDSESGFRAFSADLLGRMRVRERGFGVEWAMLQEAGRLGARIREVPIRVSYEVRRNHNPLVHLWSLVTAILRFVQRERPLMFLGLPGLLSLAVGVLLGYQTAANYYYGSGVFWPGKAMLSLLFTLLGSILLVAGLVLDAVARLLRHAMPAHEPDRRRDAADD